MRLYLYGSLLRNSRLPRYSATAAGVVNQSRPIFVASRRPFLARSARWELLIPNWAAASLSEINRSSSNGPFAYIQAEGIIAGSTNLGLPGQVKASE